MFASTNRYKLFSFLESSVQNNSKIIGFKPENKLFQGGTDDNSLLIDQPITKEGSTGI